jgi:transposase, IS5 family
MLVDRYEPEDLFARVPQAAARLDPVLKELDRLLEDDQLYQLCFARIRFRRRHI